MADLALEVLRGGLVESRVSADVAVVDSLGQIRFWWGDPDRETFWRSAAKPFQAMPLVESGAAARFGLTGEELAIIAGSHGGEPYHVDLVAKILAKGGGAPADLLCGVHPPYDVASAEALIRQQREPTVLHNNCSGKHAGMVLLARTLGASVAGYDQPDHPVQQAIGRTVAHMAGISRGLVPSAVDGCGVPTFYLSIARMAFAYARLVDPRGLDPAQAGAALLMAEALRTYPRAVAGTGRVEVTLAEATGGRLVAKGGAEAVFCLGIPERGWGVAIKADDGGGRAIGSLAAAVLADIGVLSEEEITRLADTIAPVLSNRQGLAVGQLRPVLRLKRARLA